MKKAIIVFIMCTSSYLVGKNNDIITITAVSVKNETNKAIYPLIALCFNLQDNISYTKEKGIDIPLAPGDTKLFSFALKSKTLKRMDIDPDSPLISKELVRIGYGIAHKLSKEESTKNRFIIKGEITLESSGTLS